MFDNGVGGVGCLSAASSSNAALTVFSVEDKSGIGAGSSAQTYNTTNPIVKHWNGLIGSNIPTDKRF